MNASHPFRLLAWILAFLLLTGAASAAKRLEPAVEEFVRLFELIDREGPTSAALSQKRWPDHEFLASYLEGELLLHPRGPKTLARLQAFLSRWPDHALADRIQKLADLRMAEEGSDQEALAWFDRRPPEFAAGQTRYTQVLLQAGRLEEAFVLYRKLFRQGADFPDSLDKAAKEHAHIFHKRITREDEDERARAFVKARHYKNLSRFLVRLSKERQTYFQAMVAAQRGEKGFKTLLAQLPEKEARSGELWAAWIDSLWSRKKRDETLELLSGKTAAWLPAEDRQRLRFQVGRHYLYLESKPALAFPLLEGNAAEAGGKLSDSLWLAGFTAHLLGKKEKALERFQQLAREGSNPGYRSQGAFWAAKLMREAGQDGSSWLSHAARAPNSFYGMLAADEVAKDQGGYKVPAEPCPHTGKILQETDGLYRLRVLEDVGRKNHQGAEIDALGKRHHLRDQDRVCLALSFRHPNKAVKIAREVEKDKEVVLWNGLYPVPEWQPSAGWILEQSLVWGLVRQESMFQPQAVSSAGAKGLMQLMPATARNEAKLAKQPLPTGSLLERPEYNLTLGQSYLKRMLDSFDGDKILALVSYNAGPGRAVQWRPMREKHDSLTFLELVPFTETRDYVKKVLHNFSVYRRMNEGKSPFTLGERPQPGSNPPG